MDNIDNIKKCIIEYLNKNTIPQAYDKLVDGLKAITDDLQLIKEAICQLECEGKIIKTNKKKYALPEKLGLILGKLQVNDRGYGFVIPENANLNDIYISSNDMNSAMNNDKVIAKVFNKKSRDRKQEGEIVRIIQRANTTIVGVLGETNRFGYIMADDSRISDWVIIPKYEYNNAIPGQKVVAEITKWPEKSRHAEGKIIEIIGNVGDPGVDILSIIKSYNIKDTFNQETLKQTNSIKNIVTDGMLTYRKDLRNLRMVTIDGEDAKDLDDAVSIEKLDNGLFRLGVHIADVSYYVTENSPLDKEALQRGTSVYLVDRVIPMLPKELSNGICSLNPQVDRLAFSVIMDINSAGKVVNHEIFESVININERMTYTNVYKILVEQDSFLCNRYRDLIQDFKDMEELSHILTNRRKKRGALDFDFCEAKIILDDKGTPVEIKKYEITIANKIIEEFMLVCNETVAERFYWQNAPFVYRIHEEPDDDKIHKFAIFASNLGYRVKGINSKHAGSLQDILEKVKGSNEERIISTVMLRSLQKAKYSHENKGHFGLAAKYYCHFTSPIRRYPDLIIHRIMKECINGKMDDKRAQELFSKLPEIAQLCSEKEKTSEEAERETQDLKKVEFMRKYIGETFKGVISSVTSFGMFVELDNTIEGLIRLNDIEDDYYIFNDQQYTLMGERTGKVFKIGQEVEVKLVRADVAARQISFVLC